MSSPVNLPINPGKFYHLVKPLSEMPTGLEIQDGYVAARLLIKFAGSVRETGEILLFKECKAMRVIYDNQPFFLLNDSEILGVIQ